MALKDTWTDKVDGKDYILAADVNSIAKAVIQNELAIGEIEVAFNDLHAYAQTLIGGVK